jgi:FdhD protein
VREDIGRHNAVDKAIGRAFLDKQLPLSRSILLVSGRASFEIVQKALSAGIPIVASVSAPSTLAVNFARENNQTLIGFLRPPSFNIYAHIERVILEPL